MPGAKRGLTPAGGARTADPTFRTAVGATLTGSELTNAGLAQSPQTAARTGSEGPCKSA